MSNDLSASKYSLSLSGHGINVEREIDQNLALRILSIVMGGGISNPSSAQHGDPMETAPVDRAQLSLREYLDEVHAVRKPDQILAIAHFICEHEGAEDFDRNGVKSRFSTAREPLPANFGRDFANAISSDWIHEVHGKSGRYYVTTKGLQAIESRFSSGLRGATASNRRRMRRRRPGDQTGS